MPNLFCCCLNVEEKNFYLIINTFDLVILSIGFLQLIGTSLTGEYGTTYSSFGLSDLILLILAGASMIIYLKEKTYKSKVHAAYFYVRFFFCILILIFITIFLLGFAFFVSATMPDSGIPLAFIIILGILFLPILLLEFYWSRTLIKMLAN